MTTLNPYLTFPGNGREAMEFYRDCFRGELSNLQTFGEAGYEDESTRDRLMHGELRAGDLKLMASDGRADFQAIPGNTVSLSLHLADESEQTRVFDALAEGGSVTMPLQDTFWGARFGMVTDRYGIQWMLNYQKS
jgi:PhnB protein